MTKNLECTTNELRLGELAPKFEMDAVMPTGESLGRFGKVSLEENMKAGKWTILYFYPLDFTFVCPTELKALDNLYPEFQKAGAELIACSTDSVFSHLAWQDRKDLGRLAHPHASDITHEVSKSYNVFAPDKGFSWRGTFIISPEGILRTMSVNHGEIGRNADEVLRTLHATQAAERGEKVPCGYQPGDSFLTAK